MNEFFQVVLLGIVEGLTEFLPISSTGHLILLSDRIGFSGEFANLFNVFIQLGAILAVVFYYRSKLILEYFSKKLSAKQVGLVFWNRWQNIAIAFIPAAILGLLLDELIERHLFTSLTVAVALIVGALWIIYSEKRVSSEALISDYRDLSKLDSLKVGFYQCLALFPGFSRSGATIIGGLNTGLTREAATEFSFMLAIPTIAAASLFKLLNSSISLNSAQVGMLTLGTGVAFAVALACIRFLLQYVRTNSFIPFAAYRILLAAAILLQIFFF